MILLPALLRSLGHSLGWQEEERDEVNDLIAREQGSGGGLLAVREQSAICYVKKRSREERASDAYVCRNCEYAQAGAS